MVRKHFQVEALQAVIGRPLSVSQRHDNNREGLRGDHHARREQSVLEVVDARSVARAKREVDQQEQHAQDPDAIEWESEQARPPPAAGNAEGRAGGKRADGRQRDDNAENDQNPHRRLVKEKTQRLGVEAGADARRRPTRRLSPA